MRMMVVVIVFHRDYNIRHYNERTKFLRALACPEDQNPNSSKSLVTQAICARFAASATRLKSLKCSEASLSVLLVLDCLCG